MWGAEAVIDTTIQTFFAIVLAWMLYTGERRVAILAMAALPAVMDLDHILPTYLEGIKAFHSMFFIYSVSGAILLYGYMRGSNSAKKAGIASFTILLFSISIDLLQGGKIAFMYPFSSQAYALPYFGAYEISRVAVITLMLFVIAIAYAYQLSLGSHECAHRRHLPRWTDFRDRTYYGIRRSLYSSTTGSESVIRVSALLASFIIAYGFIILTISR